MSVVVRMEMPQNCCECQLRKEDYDTEEEFCPFTGVECLSIGRQDNCPIVCALPENHGRLVDADANFLGVIHLNGGGFANYNTTIAERLGKEDMWAVKTIVPAEAERTET